MHALKSISARMIIAITLVAAASCAFIAGFAMWQQQATVDVALERELRADYANLIAAIDAETRTAQAVSNALAVMPPVKDVVRARDRDGTLALLKDVMAVIQPRGLELITIHVPPSIAFLRAHKPATFGDNVGARRKMVLQSFATGKSLGGVETGLDQLNIFATSPIMNGDKVDGLVDVGAPFGKTFVTGVKSRFGLDVAIHTLDGETDKVVASTLSSNRSSVPSLRRALAGEVVLQQGDMDGHPAATAFGPIRGFSGEPIAILEIVRDTSAYAAVASRALTWMALAAGCVLLLAAAIAFFVGRSMARPIQALENAMRAIASGHHETVVPGAGRNDEIGSMAKAVEVFKLGLIETGELRGAQEQQRVSNEAERRQAMHDLAARFEAGVGGVVDLVGSAATELRSTADSMAGIAKESERRIVKVTGASAQASSNAQAVAAAVEELDASINEIGQRVNQSAKVAGEAAGQAEITNEQVKGLAAAAQKIGDVVTLISDIAAQTNLLALNATIEAARAGEAGRGFAVVASEVKALASQTSKATEEISSQVGAIQAATQSSVVAIEGITATIGRVNEIASAIAAAVAEQGTATREIAHNVAEAARSTGEVSDNIGGVNQAAQETGAAAGQVVHAAGELSRSGETLKSQVATFLREVRAG